MNIVVLVKSAIQVDFLAGQVTLDSWYQRVFLICVVKL